MPAGWARCFILGLSWFCWLVPEARSEDHPFVEAIRRSAQKQIGDIETGEVFKEAESARKYLGALDLLEKRLAAAGDVEAIARLREEKEAVGKNGGTTAHGDKELADLRAKYHQLLEAVRRETDAERTKVTAIVRQALVDKQKELVKTGDVDGALRIREEGERLVAELPAQADTAVGKAGLEVRSASVRTANDLKSFLSAAVWKVSPGGGTIRHAIEFGADGNCVADHGMKLGRWWCDDARIFHVGSEAVTGIVASDGNSFGLLLADGTKVQAIRVENPYHGKLIRLKAWGDPAAGLSLRRDKPVQIGPNPDTLRIVPGFADPQHVSLQSSAGKDYYIRHANYILQCHERPKEMTTLFRSDSTFKLVRYEDGAISLEAVNYPGFFVTMDVAKGQLVIRRNPEVSAARFLMEPGG